MATLLHTAIIAFLLTGTPVQGEPETWSGFGLFTVTPEAPVPEGYAQAITDALVPPSAWKQRGLPYADSEKAKAYLIDYGAKGKLITVDRWLSLRPNVRFALHIENPEAVPLRHKIMIGTDKAAWEILKRSAISGNGEVFHRAYLLRRKEGDALLGVIFHGGSWSTIEWPAPSTPSQVAALEYVTQSLAAELRRTYPVRIAPLAESLGGSGLVPERSDLPDPDAQPRVLNANEFAS